MRQSALPEHIAFVPSHEEIPPMSTTAAIPENEEQRLEWLRQCEILDTVPEAAFDEAAHMAAELCHVPIAAINIVDRNRQWSKAAVGQDKNQDSRDVSFCAHAILGTDLLVVPDARHDRRFADNPLVTGGSNIRFYAGAPLITTEGFALGSLCIVDRVPRQITPEQAALLRLLARQVTGRIELMRHIALQNKLIEERERLLGEVQQAAERQRGFLRDVLSSVTGGKLRLCLEAQELPAECQSTWIPLAVPGDLWELRRRTEEAAILNGMAERRRSDLVTAAGEAGMNAVVHGGGGHGRVCGIEGTVQVWVKDSGHGIEVDRLPRAALERGYTTAGTLGQGMKMMLDTADRVYLLTGADGTTVVLEQDREEAPPAWLSGAA